MKTKQIKVRTKDETMELEIKLPSDVAEWGTHYSERELCYWIERAVVSVIRKEARDQLNNPELSAKMIQQHFAEWLPPAQLELSEDEKAVEQLLLSLPEMDRGLVDRLVDGVKEHLKGTQT